MKNKLIGDVVLSAEQIKSGVSLVAKALNEAYRGKDLVIVTVVPGGIIFTADLVRELAVDIHMDYISCPHTPGDRNNRSTIAYNQTVNIKGKYVVLVDDAIESGGTMKRLVQHITEKFEVASVAIASLFVKPGRVEVSVPQYFAYEMDNDDMLVGYGLPWNDKYRNLPYVSKLEV